GGKLYIDSAHSEFRRLNPDIICILSSPCLSVQRGSPSSIANQRWYDGAPGLRVGATWARAIRDELWRRRLTKIAPPASASEWTRIDSIEEWPSHAALKPHIETKLT